MWEDKNQLSSVALMVDGATTMDSDKTGASLQERGRESLISEFKNKFWQTATQIFPPSSTAVLPMNLWVSSSRAFYRLFQLFQTVYLLRHELGTMFG